MQNELPQQIQSWLQQQTVADDLKEATIKWLQKLHNALKQNADTQWHIGLNNAKHCKQIGLDYNSTIAAILLPVLENEITINPEIIANPSIPKPIQTLLEKTIKCTNLDNISWEGNFSNSAKHKRQSRHILLSLVEDMRTIPILLSRRLTQLEYAKQEDINIQKKLATHTQRIYISIANRLGFGELKWQLEDFCMRYLDNVTYKQIATGLELKRAERENIIKQTIAKISGLLNTNEISNYQINGRAKHLQSIYNKMQKKNTSLDKLYDQLALRIIVPTINNCYQTLSLLHKFWRHHQDEFDDYISNPKENGYQSIHTVIFYDDKHPIEIQIRTYAMHEACENGAAAHWAYKERSSATAQEQKKLQSLRQLLDLQQHLEQPTLNETRSIADDYIYIFTPEGHIREIPTGATGLDFAYQIHTQLGHRCRGVKINKKLSSLTQELRTGDHVEILLKKEELPSRDWLLEKNGYIKTATAKRKLEIWFRKHDRLQQFEIGKKMWEEISRKNNLREPDLKTIRNKMHFKSNSQVLIALAQGAIGPIKCLRLLNKNKDEVTTKTDKPIDNKPSSGSIKTSSINELLYNLGRCCSPLPGDKIIGYITKSRGVTIHRQDCHHLPQIQNKTPERLLPVLWHEQQNNKNFIAQLTIKAISSSTLLKEITASLASANIALQALTQTESKKSPDNVVINCKIAIKNHLQLTTLKQALLRINNVLTVDRK